MADSSKFPDEWLFNHRWGKGKKDAPTKLPNGAAITFLTVGGRTSCVVPSVQKKTGAVAADIDTNGKETTNSIKPTGKKAKPKATAKKRKAESESDESDVEPEPKAPQRKGRKLKEEPAEAIKEESDQEHKLVKSPRSTKKSNPTANKRIKKEEVTGRRRSGRITKS